MVPTLRHGDVVLARRGGRPVRPGDIVLARFRARPELLVVKRAVRREASGWWIEGDNSFGTADSRVFGLADVVARVVFRYWPCPRRLASARELRAPINQAEETMIVGRKRHETTGAVSDPEEGPEFVDFFRARQMFLSRTAYLLTGDHLAAHRLVQAALVKAAAKWERLRAGGQPEEFLRQAMIDQMLPWWRRPRPAAPPKKARAAGDRAAPAAEPAASTSLLAGVLRGLSPRTRAVLVLRYFDGLSESEAAAVLRCTVGAVRDRSREAMVRWRRALLAAGSVEARHQATFGGNDANG